MPQAASRKPMAKKGQFYIFVAVLLSVFALVITQTQVRPVKPVDNFKMLYENFDGESARVFNSAAYNQQNASVALANFTGAFVDYAKSRDPGFGVLYLLRYDGRVDAVNYLNVQVNVTTNVSSFLLDTGQRRSVADNNEFRVSVGGYVYRLVFGSEDAQLRALFRSTGSGGVRVAVS